MKKIKKPKNQVIVVPTTQKSLTHKTKPKMGTKTPKNKLSAVAYYNCLLTQAQQGWYDPTTGKKKQVTACCKDCKLNAPTLNNQKNQEVKKLITSYQQVGDSLRKLLRPIDG